MDKDGKWKTKFTERQTPCSKRQQEGGPELVTPGAL